LDKKWKCSRIGNDKKLWRLSWEKRWCESHSLDKRYLLRYYRVYFEPIGQNSFNSIRWSILIFIERIAFEGVGTILLKEANPTGVRSLAITSKPKLDKKLIDYRRHYLYPYFYKLQLVLIFIFIYIAKNCLLNFGVKHYS